MDKSKRLEELKNILLPYVEDETSLVDLTEEVHLTHDLKINSYNIVEIILDIEEFFGINLADEYTGQMETIGNCLNIMQQNLAIK